MASTSYTKLYCEGKGFNLPHTDIECLAVACALRSANVDFTLARPSGTFSGNKLPVVQTVHKAARTVAQPSPKEEVLPSYGIKSTLALLKRNGKELDGSLTSEQRVLTDAAMMSFLYQIIPSFDYITLGLDEHYAVREANRTDTNSLLALAWARVGWSRQQELSVIAQQFRITSLGLALAVARKGLKTLEELLKMARGGGEGNDNIFAFGTSAPAGIDCVAFAACSGLLYAEFDVKYGEIRSWQVEVRAEVPLLMALTERVRQATFSSANTPYFSLKPILPSADSSAYDSEKPFREGRLRFLMLTAGFASLYFLVANAAALVQVLEAMEGDEEDEDAQS